ncbi:extracellular solute-binding protein [Paenibacillus arenilitoris]|uniref:Extracellular solute-binding protein n=1 Tax=Paenibacillus arenilitoris TaxID=2772299 RepID=A0A927H4Y4_9BACL|nr:extracellular solute-binding protein [Paenibacillus arenilitoris]MBD2868906.1 extracellular solute-binding protein [Paenibacillus arenilitoris]
MKRYKAIAYGVLAATMAFTIAACSGGNNDPANSGGNAPANESGNAGAEPGKKVTIEYWHTYSDQEEKVLTEEIKPLFEEEHPGIELKLTRMPYEGLKEQVIAGVAGDAAPDLMRMDIIWVPEFAKMGALQDVSKLEGFDEIKANVFEAPMETNAYDGGYYGVPVNTNTKIAIYNKAVLDEIGVTKAPETMEELEAAAKQAVAKGKPGAIGIGGANVWAASPYFWSLGGKLTSEDYTKADGFLNSPESVKALETIVRWHNEGLVTPTILGGEPGAWDGMKNKEYMMIDDGPWFYSILMNEAESAFKPLEQTVRGLIPAGPAGSHSVVGGEDLVIFANSKHPQEAWTFAKWMLGEEPQKIMSKLGLIPTNKTAANDPAFLETPFVTEFVKQLETALPRTPIPQYGEMEGIVNLAFEKAVRGELDPKAALDEAAKSIDAILAQ